MDYYSCLFDRAYLRWTSPAEKESRDVCDLGSIFGETSILSLDLLSCRDPVVTMLECLIGFAGASSFRSQPGGWCSLFLLLCASRCL